MESKQTYPLNFTNLIVASATTQKANPSLTRWPFCTLSVLLCVLNLVQPEAPCFLLFW